MNMVTSNDANTAACVPTVTAAIRWQKLYMIGLAISCITRLKSTHSSSNDVTEIPFLSVPLLVV